jgi:phosphoesterase RecJ-like protein
VNSEIRTAVPADLRSAILQAGRIALIGHVTPDADCIASMAAAWLGLRELGKEVHALLPDGTVSRRMQFLVRRAGLTPATLDEVKSCELALVLDTAKASRVNLPGKLEALPGLAVANVDHHATNAGFGRWNWVVPSASSTSELMYTLLRTWAAKSAEHRDAAIRRHAQRHAGLFAFEYRGRKPERRPRAGRVRRRDRRRL